MNKKALHTLEYDKIVAQLAEFAQTAAGKRRCEALVPMDDVDDVREALAFVSDARDRVRRNGRLSLGGARDITSVLAGARIGAVLTIPELLDAASVLETAEHARSWGKTGEGGNGGDGRDSLWLHFERLEGEPSVSREIRRCLLSDDEVANDASPGLKTVRRQLANSEGQIHTQLNRVLNASRDMLQDAIVTMRGGRYCLPVKAEYKGRFPGMVHDQSSSGSTYFIEPMSVVKLNNEIRELQIQEQKEIEKVLAKLSGLAAGCADILKEDTEVLSDLDFIFAKAAFADALDAEAPKFNDRRTIDLRNARHPLLYRTEGLSRAEAKKKVVPISVKLGGDYDLLVITGPNTGGKTVSLKTVGLLCLMGQAGLHIPADDGSELGLFTEVFADIGDEQSIEQSLSTFSAHMTNIVQILAQADENSLCLFDELGAGTDPTEGAALAMAILDHLHQQGIRTMATTHYSELKVYALQSFGVENASCEFDVESLRPTYRLLTGIPGKSNAFAIASKLGVDDLVIEQAKGYISHEELAFEDVISDLEETRKELDSERSEAAKYRDEIERLRTKMAGTEKSLAARREKLMAEADEEARQVLQEAKDFVDETIRSVRKITDDREIMKSLERERQKLNARLKDADAKRAAAGAGSSRVQGAEDPESGVIDRPLAKEDLHIGDRVHVISMGVDGTVSTLPNSKGDLFVQMGILRSKVKLSDVRLMAEDSISFTDKEDRKHSEARTKTGRHAGRGDIDMSKAMSVAGELNLIGKTTDEALPLLDKYLDDAYLARKETARIIHGRGTGALKDAVRSMLRKHPHVKSYRFGEFNEGGNGVTVVTFKD
ncbi:MAG: endonuclease MutS2 [Lachnospiraceae bacterium]|nr:endonuclease MutS2 [Lachnospiraceae bacterium]